ncbi:hypothetical protein ATERTT37_007294 [Aspergillus terreus]
MVGPIVRISPTELHVSDPDYYEVIYSRDSPRNKYNYYQRTFNAPLALITAEDHFRHRLIRSHMNPFFSTMRIRQQEPVLRALINKLCGRLEEWKNTGKPLHIEHALTCYTTDVITDYTMGEGYHYLDEPDFIPQWYHTLTGTARTLVFIRPVAFLLPLLLAMPESVTAWLNPGMELFFDFQRRCRKLIHKIATDHLEKGSHAVDQKGRLTLFDDVLSSDLPEQEKSEARLAQEMQILVSAGAETTAKAMTYILFYLLDNPELLKKLKAELEPLGPDPALIQLEQLPYLTPISMSCLLMHHDESVFPDSYRFDPERWTDLTERKRLEKYMVAFSKGSRQCIGMQYVPNAPRIRTRVGRMGYANIASLARAEILMVISTLLQRFEFELYETTVEDVRVKHDIFIPFTKLDSEGVRVLIKG